LASSALLASMSSPVSFRRAASSRLGQKIAWPIVVLDGWAMTPSGASGVLNDAAAVYFADPTIASAFVARWCAEFWHRQALPQTGRHQLSTIGSRQLGCLH
jgi:hypothetical protein